MYLISKIDHDLFAFSTFKLRGPAGSLWEIPERDADRFRQAGWFAQTFEELTPEEWNDLSGHAADAKRAADVRRAQEAAEAERRAKEAAEHEIRLLSLRELARDAAGR